MRHGRKFVDRAHRGGHGHLGPSVGSVGCQPRNGRGIADRQQCETGGQGRARATYRLHRSGASCGPGGGVEGVAFGVRHHSVSRMIGIGRSRWMERGGHGVNVRGVPGGRARDGRCCCLRRTGRTAGRRGHGRRGPSRCAPRWVIDTIGWLPPSVGKSCGRCRRGCADSGRGEDRGARRDRQGVVDRPHDFGAGKEKRSDKRCLSDLYVLVPEIGVEPTTFALRMRCSTN